MAGCAGLLFRIQEVHRRPVRQHKKLIIRLVENFRQDFHYFYASPVHVIRQFHILLLVLCLLAWSVVTPIQAGGGKQNFKAASGKVVLQNITAPAGSLDTAVKKFSDTAGPSGNQFFLSQRAASPVHSASSLCGFVYRHPVYQTPSAQAP
jgi:hypothetical protein